MIRCPKRDRRPLCRHGREFLDDLVIPSLFFTFYLFILNDSYTLFLDRSVGLVPHLDSSRPESTNTFRRFKNCP